MQADTVKPLPILCVLQETAQWNVKPLICDFGWREGIFSFYRALLPVGAPLSLLHCTLFQNNFLLVFIKLRKVVNFIM